MDGGKKTEIPRWIFLPIIAGVILLNRFGNQMEGRMILVIVAIVFILGFGALLFQSLREWKKTDEEILAGFMPLADFFRGSGEFSISDRIKQFSGFLVLAVLFLFNSKDFSGSTGRYVLIGVSALLIGIPLILALRKNSPKRENIQKRITGEQIAALIVGLIPTAFMCFFIGIGTYHGAWWFVLPPGLIFLTFFIRPLVAAIRTMLKKKKEDDPWDRPDIQR